MQTVEKVLVELKALADEGRLLVQEERLVFFAHDDQTKEDPFTFGQMLESFKAAGIEVTEEEAQELEEQIKDYLGIRV